VNVAFTLVIMLVSKSNNYTEKHTVKTI
jgi:hypothetical protein